MNKALLFIPDISGYTSFVHDTEVSHQSHILEELMNLLIDSNDLGLELAEIEGDALFYYKQIDLPSFEQIVHLAETMYVRFHTHLKYYESRRLCHCGACQNATGLTLKFIIHYGDISFLTIKNRNPKPHGRDVILAHRLLKNDVPSREYILSTSIKDDQPSTTNKDLMWLTSKIDFGEKDVGLVNYKYKLIDYLKVKAIAPDKLDLGYQSNKPISTKVVVKRPPLDIYDYILNHIHKVAWNPFIDDILLEDHEMNKVGHSHTCILQGNENHITTTTSNFGDDAWVLGEKSEIPRIGEVFTCIIIKPLGKKESEVIFEAHVKSKKFFSILLMPFFKKKMTNFQKISSLALKEYAESR